ncbi:MAG: hypothetical protein H6592_08150 [Flavobacteriales bacterium]|nr:hypothetical protein [Flavobacteriales bacterium]
MRIYPLLLCGSTTIPAAAQEPLISDTAQHNGFNSVRVRVLAEPIRGTTLPNEFQLPLVGCEEPSLHDSAQYNRYNTFMARLSAEPIRASAAAPLDEYQLVWVLHDNGYFSTVAPVDSVVTLKSMIPDRFTYPGGTMDDVTFYGERFAVRVRDVPVSMLDLTQWYFERRER